MLLKIRRFIRLHRALVQDGVLFLAGCIALFVGLIPAIQKSIVLVRDLQTLKADISRIQQKANMLNFLDQSELSVSAREVLAGVPADKSVTTLLSTIETVAQKNNMFISDMSIEGIAALATGSAKPVVKPEGTILTEEISLQGELIDLRNFLFECVRVRRLMRVKDMMLTSIPKSSMMTAKMKIEVFYLPLPQTIGKPSDVLEPFSQKELTLLDKISSYPIMFAMGADLLSPGATQEVFERPTVPVVSDPFSSPRRILTPTPVRELTPSPTPVLVPRISPSPISSPSSSLTPLPTQ